MGQGGSGLGFVDVYGGYVLVEAVFDDTRLQALWSKRDPDGRVAFPFDTSAIDWTHYVTDIHLPSVVHHARVRTTGVAREGLTRHERGRRAVLSPDRHMAAFDLENTLIASNVVESYAWLATRHLPD